MNYCGNKSKSGFTLIEVIVSVVLVSIIMVSLLASLMQLRQTYTIIHENSDIIMYSSSISRVINNDLAKNNGVRLATCNSLRDKCELILGNDNKRSLEISKNCYNGSSIIDCDQTDINTSETDVKHYVIRTSLIYKDTSEKNSSKLLYIRTLEVNKYVNPKTKDITEDGYNFSEIDTIQYSHDGSINSKTYIDQYTTITVKLNNDTNEELSKYDVILYAAGRYDESNQVGRIYSLALNSNGATEVGTTKIYEKFGVGYFFAEENKNLTNQIDSNNPIEVPRNSNMAFKGYFYYPNANNTQKYQVIDSSGNIVASSKLFKNDVDFNVSLTAGQPVIKAEWAECKSGYEIKNGVCTPKKYNIKLYKEEGSEEYTTITVTFGNIMPTLSELNPIVPLPYKIGHYFNGYSNGGNQYINSSGNGVRVYNDNSVDKLVAQYELCPNVGANYAEQWKLNNSCTILRCLDGHDLVSNECH